MKLSVVIPVYGSETILPELHRRLTQVLNNHFPDYEIIMVDDCGPGNTWGVIKQLSQSDQRLRGIQLMRNSGQGNATLCGIAQSTGDRVVTMDDDLQHPPEEIPRLLQHLLDNDHLDVVLAKPIEKKHNFFRRLGSSAVNRMNAMFLQKDVHLRFTSFRFMTRAVCDQLVRINRPYPSLGPMIFSVTRRIENVEFQHAERAEGKSTYSFSSIFRLTMNNFIGYSMLPLRVLAFIGGVGILLSILLGLYFLLRYFIIGVETTGWTSLMLVLVSVSGFNFFAFAIIGEYVLRIMHISTSTPRYTIRKESGATKTPKEESH
ncbi:MAG: glycosyltransferase [Cryomorphaceae bacterium]|nr:MAG: glycosyltransferase [Cryomorphaceae bacterium]